MVLQEIVVTMLSLRAAVVGASSLKLRLLQPPVRGICSAAFTRKSSPGGFGSVPPAGGLSAVPSGTLGLRRASGAGAAGWYDSVAASAPVHLAEQFLVSVQQASGLPWWASIVVCALGVRTLVTLPLAAYQMIVIGKVGKSTNTAGRKSKT